MLHKLRECSEKECVVLHDSYFLHVKIDIPEDLKAGTSFSSRQESTKVPIPQQYQDLVIMLTSSCRVTCNSWLDVNTQAVLFALLTQNQ